MPAIHDARKLIIAAAIAATWPLSYHASAQQVSQPATLQWFQLSQKNIETRTPDFFAAGYGSVWLPPQTRADSSTSVGYNPYDRFDLGKANDPTLYGTEKGLKSATNSLHLAGGAQVYVDFLLNHTGARTTSTTSGGVRFAPDPFNPSAPNGGGYPGFVMSTTTLPNGEFHPADVGTYSTNPQYNYQYRISSLNDIDQRVNLYYVRNPVPGYAQNMPNPGNTAFNGRIANVPDEGNRRFYPDQAPGGIALNDPRTGGAYTLYNFNNTSPMSGDPVPETAMGYLMRSTQWLIQTIGIDGFRLDAVKHVYPFVLDNYDRAVFRADQRKNLDGSSRNVFSFGECYDGDANLVHSLIRKDINSATTVGGNRDGLDFPLFYALQSNLTSNGTVNNWHKINHASVDSKDDGNANNGSQGVAFVRSHDATGAYLDNVGYAFTLMRPGRAIVYTNAKEFTGFPADGRSDALGGFYGKSITTLVSLRNSHGRGDFAERWLDDAFNSNGFSNIYVYERKNSCIVALNSAFGNTVDARTGVQTSFAAGTHLVELTGNAADPTIDVNSTIPETVVVDANRKINLSIPRNTTGVNKGYIIYGLQNPKGTMSFSNVSSVLTGAAPTAANNGTALLSSISVITADTFGVSLNTTAVTLLDGFRDRSADGDRAFVRLDDGLDVNGSGTVDFRTPDSSQYGFENFSVSNPGYSNISGAGSFSQNIDTTNLAEGYHYVTARAFRERSDGGPDIFSDFRRTIYVDRLKPVSGVNDFSGLESTTSTTRDLNIKSIDQTASQVNVFMDLPANWTDAQVLSVVSTDNSASQIDRDLFTRRYSSVSNGNHAVTIVTREITGKTSVQRLSVYTQTSLGAGPGDLNHNSAYEAGDVSGTSYGMEALIYPSGGTTNFAFEASADMNGDGLLDSLDLYALETRYQQVGASQAVKNAARAAVLRRGDINGNHGAAADVQDIEDLYNSFGDTRWKFDLDADGWRLPSGADQQDMDVLVRTILKTNYGDANLDGLVDSVDLGLLAANWQAAGDWTGGDFTGDDLVNIVDLWMLASNWTNVSPLDSAMLATYNLPNIVPEPQCMLVSLSGVILSLRRRRG